MSAESCEIFKAGEYKVLIFNGLMSFEGRILKELHLVPVKSHSTFILHDVTIGVDFHWQRDEDQEFLGDLILKRTNGNITAINRLAIDDYLVSVISSEMSATSSLELLKAHAVISRSWLLAQIEKKNILNHNSDPYNSIYVTNDEIIKWYDREDHVDFDVCADDHCQRYQGITRVSTAQVKEAVESTIGQVLTFYGSICDARFSKCCGGATELFENCWEPVNHSYLQAFVDSDHGQLPNLSEHSLAEEWILSKPDVFCNTNDTHILSQVLNKFDQETNQFFRWKIVHKKDDLGYLIKNKTGIDFGIVEGLIPIERGSSGRIIRLKIIGTLKTMIIGKELEIRKALSQTHLFSSAFIVHYDEKNEEYIFNGAGWGHGVGLCQIGAAVMSEKGYSYREILNHYFRGADIEKRY
ncbi:MAG: SpoIID/LytB domain-containing protein [Marinilabiliaceae bacterium]|nr:SpoIID/LytB domain-containing protein [Marinilabiliaceae bacterium]